MIDGNGGRPGLAGLKGFPASFDRPEIFPRRFAEALAWPDLTGKRRKDRSKRHLDGLPRVNFCCDMGDPFDHKLDPMKWLAPHLSQLASSPHQWLFLTKRARRLVQFSRTVNGLPDNVWPGVSVTDQSTARRAEELQKVVGGGPRFISYEPAWGAYDIEPHLTAQRKGVGPRGACWVIVGGESGDSPRTMDLEWARYTRNMAKVHGAAFFMKQLGSALAPGKGGDMAGFPPDLKIREMPIRPAEQTELF
jgi:protein gp37